MGAQVQSRVVQAAQHLPFEVVRSAPIRPESTTP